MGTAQQKQLEQKIRSVKSARIAWEPTQVSQRNAAFEGTYEVIASRLEDYDGSAVFIVDISRPDGYRISDFALLDGAGNRVDIPHERFLDRTYDSWEGSFELTLYGLEGEWRKPKEIRRAEKAAEREGKFSNALAIIIILLILYLVYYFSQW